MALVGLLVLSTGCKPMTGSAEAPGDYADYREYDAYADEDGDYAGAGGGAVYDEELSMVVAEASRERKAVSRDSKRRAKNDRNQGPPPVEPAPPAGDGQGEPEPAPVSESPDEPESRDDGHRDVGKRQVIYTAGMAIAVYDRKQAVEYAESLPDRLGGWLHARHDDLVVLRIPAERLDEAMDLLAELGEVTDRTLIAEDVTAAYTDLESRIRVLEEMQAQLEQLLERAKTVEQALEVRQALDAITMELELARTQMREMAKAIAFSTLTVRFDQKGPAHDIPSSNDPFGWVDGLGVETTEYR